MLNYFVTLSSIHYLLIALSITWISWVLLKKFSLTCHLFNHEEDQLITGEPISSCNYFMPQRVPCFVFEKECNKLVGLLDDLPTVKTKQGKNRLVVKTLASIDLEKLNEELNEMTNFKLECMHCVISWLLHLIYFEFSIYPERLQCIASSVGKLLNVSIGGSSNVSFTYNWQHTTLKSNSFYDARTLTNENLVPRFKILSTEESDSLWYFIKGHILMEARACNIFDGIMKLYTMDEDGPLILFRETLSSICNEMKSILTTMAFYMHKNKVLLKHWSTIQQLLRLPTFDGIRGLQNCWIFAMNFILNVKQSDDEEIQKLEESVWKHLAPFQMDLMLRFKQKSEKLMLLCTKYDDDESFVLFEKLVNHVITWRAIHRSRASLFIKSTFSSTYESTGSSQQRTLSEIQSQWDRRIKDFSNLKSSVRMTLFVCKVRRRLHQRERERLNRAISQRTSLQYEKKDFEQEKYVRQRAKSITCDQYELS